jgi:hypothetical protein
MECQSAASQPSMDLISLLDILVHKSFRSTSGDTAMADKEPFESLTGIAQQTADQITQQTKGAMENYLTWFQNAMSASPWGNIDLNKKLLSYATENVTAAVGLVQKLSQAKNLEDVAKIQTEFMRCRGNQKFAWRLSPSARK